MMTMRFSKRHTQQSVTYIELLMVAVLSGMIILGLSGIVGQALQSGASTQVQNQLQRDADFAMQRMVQSLSHTRLLLLPFTDNVDSEWREYVREETVPASTPESGSVKATAVLAMTLPAYSDLNGDSIPDADNDADGLIDEDLPDDASNDRAPGIRNIDDSGSGFVDFWLTGDENDDEYIDGSNEDPINGIDDDQDGLVDEDPPADMNNDNCPGVCGVDEDQDGLIDEGSDEDDDEDGTSNEDWYDPLVFYLDNGSLIERTPVPWDESGDGSITGRDYIKTVIAEHVRRFRVERIKQGLDTALRVDLWLVLYDPETEQEVSLRTQVLLGGIL